ncbi:MAG: penicillin-binding protein 2 [Oceanospirillaceae bacterium]|nr:penicillin-binding protein 2 [Oceanospirillaceae bacterium]MCP5334510.1 penicillin-binding protein 2 [Oceanospirillaceae bacterium]MCP5350785.1 penicillin-binding protein 2 [Oceanospirillaceae bacterium]
MSFSITDAKEERALFKRRAIIAAVFMLVMFGALVTRMVYLQVLKYDEFITKSENNRVRLQPIAPARGLIFDRNGVLLAENLPAHSLVLIPERVPDLEATLNYLTDLVGVTPREREVFMKEATQWHRPFEPITLKQNLDEEQIARIAVNSFFLQGVDVEAELVRHYPYGQYLSHLLGYVGQISEKEQDNIDPINYKATKRIGKIGLERYYERMLHGEVGYQKAETNARGKVIRTLDRQLPVPGQNITLYLDIELQKLAMDAFNGRRGALVALDTETGGILAMVSSPSFDPNPFVTGISLDEYSSLRDSLDVPLFNRASRGQYPPGSTLKPFVALSFLENKVVDPNRVIYDHGWYQLENDERIYRDWKREGHGPVNFHQAIVQSCDTYFYEMSFKTGVDRIEPMLEQFGFGQDLSVDIWDALPALLPNKDWKKATRGLGWFPGDTLNFGIGQGFMLATPLQLATATAVLANRGKWHRPRAVEYVGSTLVEDETPHDPLILSSPEYWERVVSAMHDVISGPHGTARAISHDLKYSMAGKTGTAQVVGIRQNAKYDSKALAERNRDHALFIAFAPTDEPKIAVAVIVENGESAGATAAPIARKVIDAYLESLTKQELLNGR